MATEAPALLIVSGILGDQRRYRTFHLYEQARLVGVKCDLSHMADPELRNKVDRSMVVIVHRAPFDTQVAWIEKTVHGKGGLFILDLDDLVFEPEAVKYIRSLDITDPVCRSLYQDNIHRCRKTLDVCDAVITSNEFLASSVRQLGKRAYVHRNAFSLEMQSLAEKAYHTRIFDASRIVIGYTSGTPTHDQDFTVVTTALQLCLSRYTNVELWLVGRLDPGEDWGNLSSKIKKFNFLPWRTLPELQVRFDINLAPIEINNPFGKSRSENKYVEAALLRVPTVASPNESYSNAIRQGQTGYLANDGLDWEQHLEELLETVENRLNMGVNAHRDVLERYHPKVRAEQLITTLNDIGGHKVEFHFKRQKTKSSSTKLPASFWSSAESERFPTLFQRGMYTLKYRNFLTLLKQLWIFIRRSVTPIFPYRYPLERTDQDALSR